MAFELDYAYNKEDVDVFTITAPESVSGVSGRIAGDSEATLALQHYRSESGDETIEKLVWLREDNMQPVYAELFADGTRELSIRFTSYQENGG